MRDRGQVIVELALALPFVLFLTLSMIEVGFLLIAKAHQDRATSVVVEWAADHPGESWNSVANEQLRGCDVFVTETPQHVLQATSRCPYHPIAFPVFKGLPVSSSESAVSRHEPIPEGSPSS